MAFAIAGGPSWRAVSFRLALLALLAVSVYYSGVWRGFTRRQTTVVLTNVKLHEDPSASQSGDASDTALAIKPEQGELPPVNTAAAAAAVGAAEQPKELPVTPEIEARCRGTSGDWCINFLTQPPIPAKPPPQFNKTCLWGCNFVGVCDHQAGWCRCPAGWTGDDCITRMKRPCSDRWRPYGSFEPNDAPTSFQGHSNLNARCYGTCDKDIGYCFCGPEFAMGHELAAEDQPPGSPPRKRGRPLGFHCQDLFGPQGWCQAQQPKINCPCILDGYCGPTCEDYCEPFCPNQCNGHGECNLGFCKCHEGWWGQDCAYRLPGTELTPGLEETDRPWIKNFVHTPAARDPEPGATRRRPLIYVYELPPKFNVMMLQYRPDKGTCVHRIFDNGNSSHFVDDWLYAAEQGLHEALLQSEHRTLDPEEADYFYIPVYPSCYLYPIHGFNDFPFYHAWHTIKRVHATMNMLIEVHNWIRSHHPYWDRNGGRDHIVLMTHDEASCWLPAVLRPAILLAHWGRTDLNHTSHTGFSDDDYSVGYSDPVYMPEGYEGKLGNFPCYDPEKDLVIPPMASPAKYSSSPLVGAPARERTILGFFKGRIQPQNQRYSRGIRQFLAKHSVEQDWWGKHKIYIGEGNPQGVGDSYSELLSSSIFCFVLPGDGWSARFEDAVQHGCIPVIIQDGVHVAFTTALDMDSFSIRIAQKDMEDIPAILKEITAERIGDMQKALARVWRRYSYTGYRPHYALAQQYLKQHQPAASSNEPPKSLPAPEVEYDPAEGDALETILGWLYSRIPHTRGPNAESQTNPQAKAVAAGAKTVGAKQPGGKAKGPGPVRGRKAGGGQAAGRGKATGNAEEQ